jgi:16S rRNA (guanine966-N2)-methyltransferase
MSPEQQKPAGQFEFSVIAGSLKGRKITAPDLGITRPPLTRLRRSIFDFLAPYIQDARYLDLFSGTGSYLFEAVSRGAASAVGVEQEMRMADSINHYAQLFGVARKLTCLRDNVFDAIPKLNKERKQFSIIMMAPPQYVGLVDQTLAALGNYPLLASKGMIICQHDSNETDKINFLNFAIKQQREYGNTTFSVLGAPGT